MLDQRQLSRVLSVGFDFGNEWVCSRDVCSSHGSALLASPKSSASAGFAGMLILFWPLDCCSPACPLPFGKPGRESADCCGKIPAGLGSRGIYCFFLPWFCFRLKGKDLGISHKFGMELCGMGCSQGHPSAGVGEGSRLETGI